MTRAHFRRPFSALLSSGARCPRRVPTNCASPWSFPTMNMGATRAPRDAAPRRRPCAMYCAAKGSRLLIATTWTAPNSIALSGPSRPGSRHRPVPWRSSTLRLRLGVRRPIVPAVHFGDDSHDNDVLTQGIFAKNVVESRAPPHRAGASSCWTYSGRRTLRQRELGRLIEQVISSNFAVIGASSDGPGEGDSGIVGFARSIYRRRDRPKFVRCSDKSPVFPEFSRDGPFCSCHRTEARTSRIAAACARDGRSFNRRARPAGASACRVKRRPANGRPCYDLHFNQCCGSVDGHRRCFNRRSCSACVGAATTSCPRFVACATFGADRGAAPTL